MHRGTNACKQGSQAKASHGTVPWSAAVLANHNALKVDRRRDRGNGEGRFGGKR